MPPDVTKGTCDGVSLEREFHTPFDHGDPCATQKKQSQISLKSTWSVRKNPGRCGLSIMHETTRGEMVIHTVRCNCPLDACDLSSEIDSRSKRPRASLDGVFPAETAQRRVKDLLTFLRYCSLSRWHRSQVIIPPGKDNRRVLIKATQSPKLRQICGQSAAKSLPSPSTLDHKWTGWPFATGKKKGQVHPQSDAGGLSATKARYRFPHCHIATKIVPTKAHKSRE